MSKTISSSIRLRTDTITNWIKNGSSIINNNELVVVKFEDGTIGFKFGDGRTYANTPFIKYSSVCTSSITDGTNTYTLPDKSGTVVLQSDIDDLVSIMNSRDAAIVAQMNSRDAALSANITSVSDNVDGKVSKTGDSMTGDLTTTGKVTANTEVSSPIVRVKGNSLYDFGFMYDKGPFVCLFNAGTTTAPVKVSFQSKSGTFALTSDLTTKVDKVTGKGLSTNDYTTTEQTKLSGIAEGAQVNVIESVSLNNTPLTVTNKSVNIDTSDKVDKVDGKGLSTNDYTTADQTKLSGISTGAQVNVIETVKVNNTALTVTNKTVNVDTSDKLSIDGSNSMTGTLHMNGQTIDMDGVSTILANMSGFVFSHGGEKTTSTLVGDGSPVLTQTKAGTLYAPTNILTGVDTTSLTSTNLNSVVNLLGKSIKYEADNAGTYTAVTVGTRKDGTQKGQYSFTLGTNNEASVTRGVAIGANCTATGTMGIAIGSYCTASATQAYAKGLRNTVSASYGMAMGRYVTVDGSYSIGMGRYCWTSHMEDSGTVPDSYCFIWSGASDGGTANYYYSHGQGTYNINPEGGIDGFYIANKNISTIIKEFLTDLDTTTLTSTNDGSVLKRLNTIDESVTEIKATEASIVAKMNSTDAAIVASMNSADSALDTRLQTVESGLSNVQTNIKTQIDTIGSDLNKSVVKCSRYTASAQNITASIITGYETYNKVINITSNKVESVILNSDNISSMGFFIIRLDNFKSNIVENGYVFDSILNIRIPDSTDSKYPSSLSVAFCDEDFNVMTPMEEDGKLTDLVAGGFFRFTISTVIKDPNTSNVLDIQLTIKKLA